MNRKKSLNFTHSHQKLQNFVDFDTAQKQQKHFSNRETTVTGVFSEIKLTKIG